MRNLRSLAADAMRFVAVPYTVPNGTALQRSAYGNASSVNESLFVLVSLSQFIMSLATFHMAASVLHPSGVYPSVCLCLSVCLSVPRHILKPTHQGQHQTRPAHVLSIRTCLASQHARPAGCIFCKCFFLSLIHISEPTRPY